MKEEVKVDDPFTEWQGDEIKICDDLVYVLRVTNTTDEPLKFRIDFKEGLAGSGSAVNLVWPSQGLLGSIGAREDAKVIAVLPKVRAEPGDGTLNEIQKLQVTLTGQVDAESKAKADNAAGAANYNAGNQGTNESKHDVSVGITEPWVSDSEKTC